MLEATCRTCGETFNPADETDTVHLSREDGAECGGPGEIVGEWYAPSDPRAAALMTTAVVGRIEREVLPVWGLEAFREDAGGLLAYHGFDEPDDVCARAIACVLEQHTVDEEV